MESSEYLARKAMNGTAQHDSEPSVQYHLPRKNKTKMGAGGGGVL